MTPTLHSVLSIDLPPKEHCEGFDSPCSNTDAEWGHNGTMYEDPLANLSYLCTECRALMDAYWAERWAEYYSMVL